MSSSNYIHLLVTCVCAMIKLSSVIWVKQNYIAIGVFFVKDITEKMFFWWGGQIIYKSFESTLVDGPPFWRGSQIIFDKHFSASFPCAFKDF